MIPVIVADKARRDLRRMDKAAARIFVKHIDKISGLPPRRHLKHGLPFSVDEVGGGRLVYEFSDGALLIIRCFASHTEYEKWYKSYS